MFPPIMQRGHTLQRRLELKTMLLLLFGALLPALFPAGGRTEVIGPDDPNIQYRGRWDFSNPHAPRTGWPGTSLAATFQGASIKGTFIDDNGENRIYVKIDDRAPAVIRLTNTVSTYVLARDLADTKHTLEIVKMTEGCCGALNFAFLGFELGPGKRLLDPPARPALKLDFYGDSFAAGYSDECTCNSGDPRYKNADHAFPAITARLLHAEYHNQSWSGIGLSRGYEKLTMPQVFNRTLPGDATPLWNFSRYQPDCVVIELGDNDIENGATADQVKSAMVTFVTNDIRRVYPKTPIVLMETYGLELKETSTFIGEIARELSQAGVSNLSILRSPGAVRRGPAFMGAPWLSGEHPVYCQHVGYANMLAAHIAAVLKLPPPTPLPTSCLPAPETVANGSFEQATLPGAGEADGWRSVPGKGSVALVSGPGAHSGTRYVQLNSRAGPAGIFQPADAYPHRTYQATAYLRSGSGTGTGKLRIEFRDQAQKVIAEAATPANLTREWQPVTVSARAPDQTWQVRVVCVSDTGATVDFDDVTLSAR
jgi:hypothetical protein